MVIKYGELSDLQLLNYKSDLTNRIFKILPLKEINCSTVDTYIASIIYELCGCNYIMNYNGKILSLICILEMIKNESNHDIYKQKIFQCINDIIPMLFEEGEC